MKAKNNNIHFGALSLIGVLFFMACADPNSGTLHVVYVYPQELWGEWIRMDTGKIWVIGGNYLTHDSLSGSSLSDLTLTHQSENVIEVTDSTKKYYLYASRIANADFTGQIEDLDQTSRSLSRSAARDADGWLLDVRDLITGGRTTIQTGAGGKFKITKGIPGNDLLITPPGGKGATVTPIGDGDDVGTITITEGANFKTTIKAVSALTDMALLYAGDPLEEFDIVIENTGTEDCTAATYSLDYTSSGLTVVETIFDPVLGTIEPGKTKTLRIKVSCPSVTKEYEYKRIGITIKDRASGKQWEDFVSLKFHETFAFFEIQSNKAISGVIITPTANTYYFTCNGYERFPVPRSLMDYLIVFSGATAETEAKYSLAVETFWLSPDFTSFDDTMNYESNSTESMATLIGPGTTIGPKIMSYLHKNDIDYYRVNLGP
jgi:hypothetical protein